MIGPIAVDGCEWNREPGRGATRWGWGMGLGYISRAGAAVSVDGSSCCRDGLIVSWSSSQLSLLSLSSSSSPCWDCRRQWCGAPSSGCCCARRLSGPSAPASQRTSTGSISGPRCRSWSSRRICRRRPMSVYHDSLFRVGCGGEMSSSLSSRSTIIPVLSSKETLPP